MIAATNVNIADEFEIGEEEMQCFLLNRTSNEQGGLLERGGISYLLGLYDIKIKLKYHATKLLKE